LAERILATESPLIPKLSWLVAAAEHLHASESSALWIIWAALLVAGIALTAGFACRASAIALWLLHLAVAKSGALSAYGVDNFMTIGLFYLMVAPLPDRAALDRKLRPHASPPDPRLLGFFRGVLQVHLCFVYFFAGLAKALGSGWWDGTNLWRALSRPPFNIISPDLLAHASFLLPPLGVAIVAIELGYPIFIWLRQTRLVWLVLVCGMHVGIAFTMSMHLFGLVMIILNVAAFGPSDPRLSTRRSAAASR
ncbi:MAG: HTTM domain-containing protein, partial [Verrucomicrobiota bacterium]|nr:HTTM domain-containing protein [Verrucomicrobiota bacterium]